MHQLARGDAFSIATNPSNKWMTCRCCNQTHNSHTIKLRSTGKDQTGFKLIQTRLIPCSRFVSGFRQKTCKVFFHALSNRPRRTPEIAELTYPRRILAVDVGDLSKEPETE